MDLIKLNNEAISRFVGKSINVFPKKEYFVNDFGEQSYDENY